MTARAVLSATAVAALLQGCAGTGDGPSPALVEAPAAPAAASSTAAYTLNAEELALDCRKLTGRMQVRILQIRDYRQRDKTTLLSRGMQVATTTVIGGTSEGVQLDARYEKDRAMLEAYNGQLAAKKCKTFDLEKELANQDPKRLPTPKPDPVPEKKQKP